MMQEVFPAHHRKRIALMLKGAQAELRRRGIEPDEKTALQIFSLRAAERSKDRSRSIAAKQERAKQTGSLAMVQRDPIPHQS